MPRSSDTVGNPGRDPPGWLGSPALFLGAALVVVWQNSRVAVLWDISYVLNTASRIAGGEAPYRDFPIPHAPGTFLVQALLVRLFDGPFVVQIAYAAVVSGLAAVATFGIVRRLLEPHLRPAGWISLALAAPTTILGVYSVFPHPFYDPDCSAVMLAALLALLACQQRGWPPLRSALGGALVPLPMFFKQNTGGAFCVLACAALFTSALAARSERSRGEVWALAGALTGLAAMVALVHCTVGLEPTYHWTITYAAQRRLIGSPLSLLDVYRDTMSHVALGAAVGAAILLRWARPTLPATLLAVTLLLFPFLPLFTGLIVSLVPSFGLALLAPPPSWFKMLFGRGLFAMWPSALALSLVAGTVRVLRSGPRFDIVLPFVLVGVAHAAFLSRGVVGSSYALWPILLVMLASSAATIAEAAPDGGSRVAKIVVPVVGVMLTLSGAFYVKRELRLTYAKVFERPIFRAQHPRLLGMATGGTYLPDLDALLAFCEQEIPREDAVLALPGEDPLYFALRRPPPLPVAQYDPTLNPYYVGELVKQVHERGVSWIIVKDRLQINTPPFRDQWYLLQELAPEFPERRQLGRYTILHRRFRPVP